MVANPNSADAVRSRAVIDRRIADRQARKAASVSAGDVKRADQWQVEIDALLDKRLEVRGR